ncbi:protein of unknown function [Clostridium beijerinckii]|nr:protein of unknown function [Clostridium beijerinckii]
MVFLLFYRVLFNYKEPQELLNRISIVKSEYISLCNKKIRVQFKIEFAIFLCIILKNEVSKFNRE